jgi:hypothetical protein
MPAPRTAPAEKMKKSALTADHLRSLVHYDMTTGVFTRIKSTCNRVKVGDVCGSLNTNGYLQVSIENRLYLLANLAVLYVTGSWPIGTVDHRNTIRTDNRWSNLRDVSNSVNQQNHRAARRNNKSGFLGVSPAHGRWAASIGLNKKKVHLGLFDTPELAHAAYVAAKRELHPGNTL